MTGGLRLQSGARRCRSRYFGAGSAVCVKLIFTRADMLTASDRPIARRDFLQGALVTAAATLSGPLLKAYAADAPARTAAQDIAGYYPPSLNGLRASHPGSFEEAHALRDGPQSTSGANTGEAYDLVVVGAGISGLSAAQ